MGNEDLDLSWVGDAVRKGDICYPCSCGPVCGACSKNQSKGPEDHESGEAGEGDVGD